MHALLIHTPWRWPPKTASFWGSWNRTKPTQEFCKDDGDKFGWCCFSDFAVFFFKRWKDATFCLNVVFFLVFFVCVCVWGGGMSSWRRSWARIALERQVCHCSKPQLSSKIGATSLVKRSTKVGMMAWLSDHAFVLLQIFNYLFTCKIFQNFIGRDWRFAHKGLGSYVNLGQVNGEKHTAKYICVATGGRAQRLHQAPDGVEVCEGGWWKWILIAFVVHLWETFWHGGAIKHKPSRATSMWTYWRECLYTDCISCGVIVLWKSQLLEGHVLQMMPAHS